MHSSRRLPIFTMVALLAGCVTEPPAPPPRPTPPQPPMVRIPSDLEPLIAQYLDLSGIDTSVSNLVLSIMRPIQMELPNVPEEFWTNFASSVDADEMYHSYGQLVADYYSREQLEAIVAFLATDPGRRFIQSREELPEQQAARLAAWARKVKDDLVHALRLKRYMY